MSLEAAAIGLRVKSGRAIAVLLAGPPAGPKVIDRRMVQLADPEAPDSSQPYHAALDLTPEEGERVVARLVKIVERAAGESMLALFRRYRDLGYRILGVGIVVGSDVDPATIKNDHIRAHAAEGRLFRVVVEAVARRSGLATSVTMEKELLARASRPLRRPERRLREEVTALGRGLGGPWRAEEKAAALAAWMVLASPGGTDRPGRAGESTA